MSASTFEEIPNILYNSNMLNPNLGLKSYITNCTNSKKKKNSGVFKKKMKPNLIRLMKKRRCDYDKENCKNGIIRFVQINIEGR